MVSVRTALLALAAAYAANVFAPQQANLFVAAQDDSSVQTPPEPMIVDSTKPITSVFSETELEKIASGSEKHVFETEVSRMLDIIINSLYTKKEVFLRELISNGSDALDKIRFHALSNRTALGEGEEAELKIQVASDPEARTLTIRDTGIGMTREHLISYLGTLARSGTASLMEQLAAGADMSLIGQFGVGFYSVFLVADKVRVVTKHNNDTQQIWESSADGSYTIAEDPRGNTLGRGTEITMFLKDDALEFTEEAKLESLVRRYSQFIMFPIYLKKSETHPVEGYEPPQPAEGEEPVESSPPPLETHIDWVQLNDQKAIWSRNPEDVTPEEYVGFYKTIVKDQEPYDWVHFKAEGDVEFRSILYIPQAPPSDMYDNYYGTSNSLRLFVKKVLIADEFEDLLPRYLNFIKGVVDSDDLPLNVNREQLQHSKLIQVISKKLTRKALELLKKLSTLEERALSKKEGEDEEEDTEIAADESLPAHLRENPTEAYSNFWNLYSKNIKLGVIEDAANRSKLVKLLRFISTKTGVTKTISLDKYVDHMKEGQKQIYYIAGESYESVMESPFLDRFKDLDLEVLLLVDPIDEYTMQHITDYGGYKVMSITKENLVLPGEEKLAKFRSEHYKTEYSGLVNFLQKSLGKKVEKVTISNRLKDFPAVIVTAQFGYSANMERIMKSQAFSTDGTQSFMAARRTLEINPLHPIIAELNKRVNEDGSDSIATDAAELIYETALMNSGFAMADPKSFSHTVYRLLKSGLGLESLDLLPDVQMPEEEEEVADIDVDDEEEL